MTETVLDRYFALLSGGDAAGPESESGSGSERLGELFAPRADVNYGGEVAIGEWVLPFHRHMLGRRQHSTYTSSSRTGPDGELLAEWSESGTDRAGGEYRAAGSAAARLDSEGRIVRLSVGFRDHTDWAWRIVRRHSEAWVEADPALREAKIGEAYAEELTFVAGEVIHGRAALGEFSRKAQEVQPVVLAQVGTVLASHDHLLYEWRMVTAAGDEASGWEVQRVDGEGRIAEIVMFTHAGEVVRPG